MTGGTLARPVSAPRPSSAPGRPGGTGISAADHSFDAELSAALRPPDRATSRSEEDRSPAVEQKQSDTPEEKDEDQPSLPGVPLLFPFAPTPAPIPLLPGRITLTSGLPVEGEAQALAGGDEAAGNGPDLAAALNLPLPNAEGANTAVPSAESAAASALGAEQSPFLEDSAQPGILPVPGQPGSDPAAVQVDGAGTGLDVLLAEFAPSPKDTAPPEGLRLAPNALSPDAGFAAPALKGVATDVPATAPQPESQTVQPSESRPRHETTVEKPAAPDEGVGEALRGATTLRHEAAPATTPKGEAVPAGGATSRELPAQVARLSASLVRELAGDGVKEIRVRLDPPSLGEIHVRVESERGELRIHVVAASPETAALLSDGQSNLRDELARQGMALANFSASTESAFSFASGGGFTPREQTGGRSAGPGSTGMEEPGMAAVPTRRVSDGRLDARA